MKNTIHSENRNSKIWHLIIGLILDGIGMLSFTIPFLGEFSDVIWAPVSAFLMTKMYKGRIGKLAGVISFTEELFPFTDFVPTFTLTWFYFYIIKRNSN